MKKMVLTGLRKLEEISGERPEPREGEKLMKVLACAVCRTDAKMWDQGHRDLVFPRVPGHEVVVRGENGDRFVIWPGRSCGRCRYCLEGRENLCEDMTITGFHHDGGFAEYLVVPEKSLVPLPGDIPISLACMAEPVGCVLNALSPMGLQPGDRVAVFGGGTVGLMAALASKTMGADPLLIEKSEEKIQRISPFLEEAGIECLKETREGEFDVVINACPDPIAFSMGVVKLARGGRFAFFSGLTKNEHLETNLVNLIHYKEAAVTGAYGLTRKNMEDALPFIRKNHKALALLVEDILSLDRAGEVLPRVLAGRELKFILDVAGDLARESLDSGHEPTREAVVRSEVATPERADVPEGLPDFCRRVIAEVSPPSDEIRASAQARMDNKTKPLGALGKLEEMALQLCRIQNSLDPVINARALFVFAGDHGITEEGVSAYPSEVTGQMVDNFLRGGAAINVLCRHYGIKLKIVDMGVNADFEPHPDLILKKVRKGTRNFAIQPAMTEEEMGAALQGGMEAFLDQWKDSAPDIVGMGEMGIGNTSSASAIISAVTGISPSQATGRGTGVDDKGLQHKAQVIERALAFHQLNGADGFEILQKVGGYEIAGIAGAVLAAASRGTAVVLDGVIVTAAGLLAHLICPHVRDYLISGHKSVEAAQEAALAFLGLEPVIDFRMRLGEGTGAAITIDSVAAACRIMGEMASFDDAGVSKKG